MSPVACKRVMQLGGAAADLPHALEHRRHLGRFGGSFVGQQALLVDQTVERGAGDAPGIALVLDEGVDDRERAAALALDQFDRAEQSGRILEMRDVGQEAADLDLRMNARRDAAQNLHDKFVVDDHAGVRLLAVDRLTVLISGGGAPPNAEVGRNSILLYVAADRFRRRGSCATAPR